MCTLSVAFPSKKWQILCFFPNHNKKWSRPLFSQIKSLQPNRFCDHGVRTRGINGRTGDGYRQSGMRPAHQPAPASTHDPPPCPPTPCTSGFVANKDLQHNFFWVICYIQPNSVITTSTGQSIFVHYNHECFSNKVTILNKKSAILFVIAMSSL